MNPIIDQMLTVTAEIAELLLAAKDSDLDGLPSEAKLRIIELAEMASQVPEIEIPEDVAEEEIVASEEEAVETEKTAEEALPAEDSCVTEEANAPDTAATGTESGSDTEEEPLPADEPAMMSDEEFYFDGTTVETPEPEPEPAPAPPATDLSLWRRLFSINDMFLFRRELFNGSEMLMNDALAYIGTASTLDDVRGILADRYGIDLRSRAAKDFIATIATLF